MRTSFTPVGEIGPLVDEWSRLHALADASFFLSPAWIETLLSASAGKASLGVIRIFDDLRGVYGMALLSAPHAASFPALREAHLNESGESALDRIYIEYNDILLATNAPAGAREAAVAAIFDAAPKADQFVFRNVRPALAQAIEFAADDAGLEHERLNETPTFQIDLKRGAPMECVSSSLRAKIRRSIRRYEERGPLRVVIPENAGERAVAWTELMRLHAETWAQRGMRGAFHERGFCDFHEKLAEKHAPQTSFARLLTGSETIGVLYNFIDGDCVRNYQSGFRYEADNQLAPGFVAHMLAAEKYREMGFETYDMMGGDAEYKRRLGSEGEELATLSVTRKGWRKRARSTLKSLSPFHGARTRQT